MSREVGGEDGGERVDQVDNAGDGPPYAEQARQEGRPDNEIAGEDIVGSEQHYAQNVYPGPQLEKQQCHPLQLLLREGAQGLCVLQDNQGSDIKERDQHTDGDSDEAEERRQQCEAAVYRTKQVV